mmetsp:Transcript_35041/g.78440  ORF Transcript_35041/g.78440 Transcript_35041/m.78440 type:complete len:83 (-) Transcript_35041:421-669(-)
MESLMSTLRASEFVECKVLDCTVLMQNNCSVSRQLKKASRAGQITTCTSPVFCGCELSEELSENAQSVCSGDSAGVVLDIES